MPDEFPALLIIDMVKDNFDPKKQLPITPLAQQIIDPINRTIRAFQDKDWPVIFSTDSFKADDFIFTGKMKPHSLAGTEGAKIIEDLDRRASDFWLPKPRFSAFFKTGLEKRLKAMGVTLCAVAGIATHFCVLTTALDALCHDFKAVILEDCTAASPESLHRQVLDTYRKNPLYPLFRVLSSSRFLEGLSIEDAGSRSADPSVF